MTVSRFIACGLLAAAASGCALRAPPASVAAPLPSQWHAPLPADKNIPAAQSSEESAPLPHNGELTDLSQWWQQWDDPLLVQLIEAAQAVSPSIASSKSRIEQARAVRVAAGAAFLPTLDAAVSGTRASSQPALPMGTTVQAALQSSWELDVFGANRANNRAARARLEGAQAAWHDARVSVAAEVANQYYSLRACEMLLTVARSDATSRAETSRLAKLTSEAGFMAPATAALARASAAEGNSRATQQQALCDLDVKALVALTAVSEPDLRRKLADRLGALPQSASIAIASLPAKTLAQRPDVFNAEREVNAASADVGSAQAQRYPRLSLSGSIGAASFRAGGDTTEISTWSIGPLAMSLPIFDGGRRAANVDAASARYEEAVTKYRASVRLAVREVEEALVNLHSTASRAEDVLVAVEGFRASFSGTESRYTSGLASLVELEEARRTRYAAETAVISLQRERISAWIALYRAAGGGWSSGKTLYTGADRS